MVPYYVRSTCLNRIQGYLGTVRVPDRFGQPSRHAAKKDVLSMDVLCMGEGEEFAASKPSPGTQVVNADAKGSS